MIARALGANVVAVDIRAEALAMALELGAVAAVNASESADVAEEVREVTAAAPTPPSTPWDTPAPVSTPWPACAAGRHVQVGLMTGDHRSTLVPMDRVIAWELEMVGSHGLQAHEYDRMLRMVESGFVDPADSSRRQCRWRRGSTS